MADTTARERAFEALLPFALTIQGALDRVEDAVLGDMKLNQPLRTSFHPSQIASLRGCFRFASAVLELGRVLDDHPRSLKISSASQESQNIWMWLIDNTLVLRVKHDLTEVVDPGTAQLFAVQPLTDTPTVFLTWDIAHDGTMRNVMFASVDEPKWTISIAQLLSAAQPMPVIGSERVGGPNVRSAKQREQATEQSG
jgi:hypothetical protein